MKQTLLFLVVLCACTHAWAQDESKKPDAKAFSVEVNFNPFSSSPVNISYLRFRHFLTEKSALRMGFSVGVKNQKPQEDIQQSSFEFNLRPGYEWHFAGTERLSPYIGVEADIAVKTSSWEDSDPDAYVTEIKGAWSNFGSERGFTRLGLNVVLGADFYVAKRVYVGTELGFGFENIKYSDIEITSPDNDDPVKGGSSFQLGPNINSSLRLGFIF